MIDVTQLSREERALYNPAFTGLVVCRAVQGYEGQYGQACPVVVAVLSAVMAMQPSVRASLPRSTRSGLTRWLEESKHMRVLMAQNAGAVSAVIRPGLLLALQTGMLTSNDTLALSLRPKGLTSSVHGATEESTAIQKASHMLGRWLPSTGSLSTVMSLLGVRP